MKITIALIIMLSTSFLAVGQYQTLNPNNVLIVSKNSSKRRAVMRSGQKVKCRLKSGVTTKGQLFVYSEHIVVGETKLEFDEIAMIKPINFNAVNSALGGVGTAELIRRVRGARATTDYGIALGALVILNFTVFTTKYRTKNGWELSVQEIQPFNSRIRG